MKVKWFAWVMATVVSSGVVADDYTCPVALEVREKLGSEPAGWAGMYEKSSGEVVYTGTNEVSDTLELVEITLYAGEPKEQVSLEPANADSLSEEEGDSIWSFGAAGQAAQPLYVACHYAGSGMSVFRPITTPVKSCTWHFKPGSANNILSCIPG